MSAELWAREALRAIGIQKPSASLIDNWIRANRAEPEPAEDWFAPVQPPPARPQRPAPSPEVQNLRPKHPRGYSKSNLEPALRAQGTLEESYGIRKPGRPRVIANWFPAVARAMADGTSLRETLKRYGISLDRSQIRAVYRSEEFKRLLQHARAPGQRSPDR